MDSVSKTPLLEYITAIKAQGASDETLISMLRSGGWSESDSRLAICQYYEHASGIPLPRRERGGGNRALDGLVYLIIYITLGTWTIGVGSIFFTLIARAFPLPYEHWGPGLLRQNLAGSLAQVIVAFPIYWLASAYAQRQIQRDPEKRRSGVRRWLTAIALVLAVGTAVGDLITFVAYLLKGALTIRFVLEVITVFVISGGVLWYYLPVLTLKGSPPGDE